MDPKNLRKEYTNGELTIVWQSGLCIHSGHCAKSLPEVFRPREQPWIQPDQADEARIRATVKACPSGAISLKETEAGQ